MSIPRCLICFAMPYNTHSRLRDSDDSVSKCSEDSSEMEPLIEYKEVACVDYSGVCAESHQSRRICFSGVVSEKIQGWLRCSTDCTFDCMEQRYSFCFSQLSESVVSLTEG